MEWSRSESAAVSQLTLQVDRALAQGDRALRIGALAQSELAFEEAVRVSRDLSGVRPGPESDDALAVSLMNLGRALLQMGANPEAEEPLKEAVSRLRRLAVADPADGEPKLQSSLQMLTEVYRGAQFYIHFARAPITSVAEMKQHRRTCLANGSWGGRMPTFVSDEWKAQAEAPQLEAVAVARRMARSDAEHESTQAGALYVLGAVYIELDRASKAVEPLREAETLYERLLRTNPAEAEQWLAKTRQRLLEVGAVSYEPSDRLGALEAMLPQLRSQAHATADELEYGVTMSKAAVRDRLRKALKELAALYEVDGQGDKATELWNGELGLRVLMTEALKVRRD